MCSSDLLDLELARWRSTAFVALDEISLAFKGEALAPTSPGSDILKQVKDGIYLAETGSNASINTLLETGSDAGVVDPAANSMFITSLGLERDGYRNGRLAFVASMANSTDSFAGIYVATPGPIPVLGVAGMFRFSRTLRKRVRQSR